MNNTLADAFTKAWGDPNPTNSFIPYRAVTVKNPIDVLARSIAGRLERELTERNYKATQGECGEDLYLRGVIGGNASLVHIKRHNINVLVCCGDISVELWVLTGSKQFRFPDFIGDNWLGELLDDLAPLGSGPVFEEL